MDPSHGLSQYAPGGMLSPGKMQTVEELRDALRISMKELIAVQVRVLLFPTNKTQLPVGERLADSLEIWNHCRQNFLRETARDIAP
jgi:hypothetical protein